MTYWQEPNRTTETKEQLVVYSWCIELGFDTRMEWECLPYYIDVYLPELNLGLELDGQTHSRRKDAKKDGFIQRRYGIDIWRFKNKEITSEFKQVFIEKLEDRANELGSSNETF